MKVRCLISSLDGISFVKGEIYEVIENGIIDNEGIKWGEEFTVITDQERLNKFYEYYGLKFEPLLTYEKDNKNENKGDEMNSIRLTQAFFNSRQIKKMERVLGKDYIMIYIKLLIFSNDKNGILKYNDIEGSLSEQLSYDLDEAEKEMDKLYLFLHENEMMIEVSEDEDQLVDLWGVFANSSRPMTYNELMSCNEIVRE